MTAYKSLPGNFNQLKYKNFSNDSVYLRLVASARIFCFIRVLSVDYLLDFDDSCLHFTLLVCSFVRSYGVCLPVSFSEISL